MGNLAERAHSDPRDAAGQEMNSDRTGISSIGASPGPGRWALGLVNRTTSHPGDASVPLPRNGARAVPMPRNGAGSVPPSWNGGPDPLNHPCLPGIPGGALVPNHWNGLLSRDSRESRESREPPVSGGVPGHPVPSYWNGPSSFLGGGTNPTPRRAQVLFSSSQAVSPGLGDAPY